jgi:hypothetical protein
MKNVNSITKEEEIFTNYLVIAAFADPEVIKKTGAFLTGAYDEKSIMRMTFFNTDGSCDIDRTGGEYFYNEIYSLLSETIRTVGGESKGQPAMLCQLVTGKELTLTDLLAIQANVKDSPITVINRWHMKYYYEWESGEVSNLFISGYQLAGYLSIFNGTVSTDKRAGVNKADFIQENGIDVLTECPRCYERTTAAYIHFNGACPDCATGFKDMMRGRFIKALKSDEAGVARIIKNRLGRRTMQ